MTKLMTLRGRKPEREPLHYTACGVYLVSGFSRERIDGEDTVTIEDLDGLWKAIGLALVCGRKALAPKEVRFLRNHMDQTVARWEKGETPVEMTQADLGAELRVSD